MMSNPVEEPRWKRVEALNDADGKGTKL